MTAKPNDFQLQLERLQEKEKVARVNNEHPVSVIILKDIVHSQKLRSLSATKRSSGPLSTNRSPSL